MTNQIAPSPCSHAPQFPGAGGDRARLGAELQQLSDTLAHLRGEVQRGDNGTPLSGKLMQIADRLEQIASQLCDSLPLKAEAPLLSPREHEVLRWIALGKSNAVIGEILGISRHTVDTHNRRIFRKLNTADRTTAAIRAVEFGLV